jgi:hypothetical protein
MYVCPDLNETFKDLSPNSRFLTTYEIYNTQVKILYQKQMPAADLLLCFTFRIKIVY